MDDTAVETTSYDDMVAGAETFGEQTRLRAETEREVVEWAVDELESIIAEQGADLEPLLEYARRSKESLPENERTPCAFSHEIPTDLRTGQRWLDRLY